MIIIIFLISYKKKRLCYVILLVRDILKKDVVKIDGNESFSKVFSLFKDTDAIIITDKGKYQGMLLKRCLMKPKISLETKVHTVLTHTPKISPITPIEEIARLMVENGVYHLPVIEISKDKKGKRRNHFSES